MAKCPDETLEKEVERGLKALRASDLQKIDLTLDGRTKRGGWTKSAGGRSLRVCHVARVKGRALTMPNKLDPCRLTLKDDVTFVMVTHLRDHDVVKSFRTWWNERAEAMGKKKKKEENEKKDTIDDDSKTPPPPSELHF